MNANLSGTLRQISNMAIENPHLRWCSRGKCSFQSLSTEELPAMRRWPHSQSFFGEWKWTHQWLAVYLCSTSSMFFVRCLVKMSYSHPWNLKHPFINGSLNWMMKKLYMKNGCFTISIHFKLFFLGFQARVQSHQGYKWWPCNTDPAICTSHRSIHHWGIQIMQDGALSLVMNGVITSNPCKWLKING